MEFLEFTENNRRIHHAKDEAEAALIRAAHPDWLENPDRSKVRGILPHFWKRPASGNLIEKMNERERAAVVESHRTNGVDNGSRSELPRAKGKSLRRFLSLIPWAIAAIEAAALVFILVNR